MKIISIITHPVAVISSFLLILISGEHFGGFYMLYLLLALPHGGSHAALGIVGIGLLLFSYLKYHRQGKVVIEPILDVSGTACLFASLYSFFTGSNGYNDASFDQAVPLATLILFVLLSLGFIVISIVRYVRPSIMVV